MVDNSIRKVSLNVHVLHCKITDLPLTWNSKHLIGFRIYPVCFLLKGASPNAMTMILYNMPIAKNTFKNKSDIDNKRLLKDIFFVMYYLASYYFN